MKSKISFHIILILSGIIIVYIPLEGQSQVNTFKDNNDFEICIVNSDYSMAFSVSIILTNKKVDVVYKGGLVGEKDTLLFSKAFDAFDSLQQIRDINIDNLKEHYSNNCISDGSQVTVSFKKDTTTKTVHLSNYFQEDIGKIIYLINSFVPTKYKVQYDKKQLKSYEKLCSEKK